MSDLASALAGLQQRNAADNVYFTSGQSLRGAFAPVDPRWSSGDQIAYSLMASAMPGILEGIGRRQIQDDNLKLAQDKNALMRALYAGDDVSQFQESPAYELLPYMQEEKFLADLKRQQELADYQQKKNLELFYSDAMKGMMPGEDGSLNVRPGFDTALGRIGATEASMSTAARKAQELNYDPQIAYKTSLAKGAAEDFIFENSSKVKSEAVKAEAQDMLKLEQGQIKDIEQTDTAKMLKEALPYYQGMESAKSETSPAADLLFYSSFGKLMDPGSTVREGEIENVKNVTPYIASVIREANKQMSGQGILTPQMKEELLKISRAKIGAFQESYNNLVDRKSGWAASKGANRESLISGLELPIQEPMTIERPESQLETKEVGGAVYQKVSGGWQRVK